MAIRNASSRVAIIATAVDGTIQVFNAGAEDILRYGAHEMIGKHDEREWIRVNIHLSASTHTVNLSV